MMNKVAEIRVSQLTVGFEALGFLAVRGWGDSFWPPSFSITISNTSEKAPRLCLYQNICAERQLEHGSFVFAQP